MIRALAFDLGGVLFAEGKSAAVNNLQTHCGYEREKVANVFTSPEAAALRKGLLEERAFWNWAKTYLPPTYDVNIIKQYWYDGYTLDTETYQLVSLLKGKYPLIAFSGNVKSRIEYLDKKYHFRHLFDLEIYSFEYHLNKSQREFFEIMIEKSGVRAEEIAYVDDSEAVSAYANELGVHFLVYSTGEIKRLQENLSALGVSI